MGESEGQLWKAWKLGEGVRKLCIKKWGASAGSGAGDLCLHAQVRSNTASDKPLDKPRVMVGKERSMGLGSRSSGNWDSHKAPGHGSVWVGAVFRGRVWISEGREVCRKTDSAVKPTTF